MKTRFSSTASAVLQFLTVSMFALAINTRAQLPPPDPLMPVVTLTAPDPVAHEAGDPGAFRLWRSGPTNRALHVFWMVTGSASSGIDYQSLPAIVSIPAGVREVLVPVVPIDDKLAEGPETVAARLFDPPTGVPPTYAIGWPSNAVVTIFDNDPAPTNRHPFVHIFSPTNGATFTAPANIQICAAADSYVVTVEFFAGDKSLGIRTNPCLPPCANVMAPSYCLVWSNVPPGSYILTAKATDNLGATATSNPVSITVTQAPPHVPVVTITATDPHASEPGLLTVLDPGVFTITRTGATNFPLPVYYSIHGTASNGVDYTAISNAVVIPAGQVSANVVINPLHDNLSEPTETVMLRLLNPPCGTIVPRPAECYWVGLPDRDIVFISDAATPTTTNHAPSVSIVAPMDGAIFSYPEAIQIIAFAEDPDPGDYVDTVEFFAGPHSLGVRTNCLPCASPINPFMVSASLPPGDHVLTAKATDSRGASSISDPVHLSVRVPPPPVVAIQATDPDTSEPGLLPVLDPGVFTITRTGASNFPLPVYYSIHGTASNGLDYAALANVVVIPAGKTSANVMIWPWSDNLVEGTETVVLRLEEVACIAIFPPPPECYLVGTPREATVYIADFNRPTNHPPAVRLTKPLDGQIFLAPTNVLLRAETLDVDGYVDHVEFYDDTKLIGEETRNYFTAPPPGQPATFEMVWTHPPPGRHSLTAKARDDQGAFGISSPVVIWVVETNHPPVTNPPPIVTITAPDPIAAEGTNCCHWIGWSNSPPVAFCGTNTATFVIRRTGPTNDSLTVHYRIGGTASNGVDYVTLPGLATIPAGRRAVEFKLVPLDDALPERLETVVLGLRAPPNLTGSVPPYLVGYPSRAAAVIVDNDALRPSSGVLADRCFHLMKPSANGLWWRIEGSTDLRHWTILGTNSVTDGALHFVDPDADERPSGYYRAVPCEPPVD